MFFKKKVAAIAEVKPLLSRAEEYKQTLEHYKPIVLGEGYKKPANKTYPKEVLAIHHEFETASDRLLMEARVIIANAETKDTGKASRLERLGFNNAIGVKEAKEIIRQKENSKNEMMTITDYRQRYPLNKFITQAEVKRICEKYSLVFGESSLYKGFVPEKNLEDIERFKLKADDIDYYYISVHDREIRRHITKAEHENRRRNGDYSSRTTEHELMICAPLKDMDMTNRTITNGYKIEKVHVPDPVVLKPVRGGYLVVTAWGDEASDPIIVNDMMN